MKRSFGLTGKAAAIAVLTVLTAACDKQAPQAPPTTPTSATTQSSPENVDALLDHFSAGPSSSAGNSTKAFRSAAAQLVKSSAAIEQNSVTASSDAKPLERVQYDTFIPAQALAPVEAEVPSIWAGWYINRSIDAYKQAVAETKPFILVIGFDECKYCAMLVYDSLRCPAVDRFAGEAVFAYSSVALDKGAVGIAASLGINSYPTISVLEPESRMILERGRIKGYFDGSLLGQHLETVLWKTPPRKYLDPDGVEHVNPAQVLGTWSHPDSAKSIADAASGAAKRGLKHMPPAPKCQ